MLGDVWHCGAFVAYAEAPLRAQIIWARVYTADALMESLVQARLSCGVTLRLPRLAKAR